MGNDTSLGSETQPCMHAWFLHSMVTNIKILDKYELKMTIFNQMSFISSLFMIMSSLIVYNGHEMLSRLKL